MKFSVFFLAFTVVVIECQRILPQAGDTDEYAASLGGAPVGMFSRFRDAFGGTEVHGISLSGAKVGLAGKDRNSNSMGLPYAVAPSSLLRTAFRFPLPYLQLNPMVPFVGYPPRYSSSLIEDDYRRRQALAEYQRIP